MVHLELHLEMLKQIDFSFLLSGYACTKERNKWSTGAHHWCSQLQDAVISVAVPPQHEEEQEQVGVKLASHSFRRCT